MATREYIGARYVPKFYQNSVDGSTQWQPNVVYEPLMWVTLQNSHMYISKKQVPATIGTPAENIDYWLDIGSYNGYIEGLQDEIDIINEVTIPALQAELDSSQAELDRSQVINGENRKVICIGDSYLNGDEVKSWGAQLRYLLNNSSNTIIKGYGGSGFIGQQPAHTFQIQLSEVVESMTTEQCESVTDIVVVGGLNDKYGYYQIPPQTDNELIAAINNFVVYAHNNFPNAMVRIGVVGWAQDGLSDKQYWGKILNCFKTCATAYKDGRCQFMSGLEYIMPTIPASGYSDTVHPNVSTSAIIARGILNCMMGGDGVMGKNYTNEPLSLSWWNTINAHEGSPKFDIYGDTATIRLGALQFDYSEATSYTFGTEYAFAVVADGLPIRASLGIKIPANYWVNDNSGDPKLYSGYVAIIGGQLKMYINCPIAGITNVTRIRIVCDDYSDSVFNIC